MIRDYLLCRERGSETPQDSQTTSSQWIIPPSELHTSRSAADCLPETCTKAACSLLHQTCPANALLMHAHRQLMSEEQAQPLRGMQDTMCIVPFIDPDQRPTLTKEQEVRNSRLSKPKLATDQKQNPNRRELRTLRFEHNLSFLQK